MADGRPSEAVQRAADELYGLPFPEFTKARDEHARRLRKEGLRDEAQAVKALRKPTVAAWALNQLARRRPDEVGQLLTIGRRLREAQDALLAGGDRSTLQHAFAEERELVSELTSDATAIAGEAGGPVGESLGERIRSTLHAAALDEQTAASLAAGRLVREREAVGLFGGPPAGAEPAAPAKRRGDRRRPQKDAQRLRKLGQELRAARADEQKARREHAGAAKASERAGKRAKDAQRQADDARRRAEQARAGLREAERREREAATASDRAARAVASAERNLD
jgi:hypothetical protein